MPHTSTPAWIAIGCIALTGLTSLAWQKTPAALPVKHAAMDTVPGREKDHDDETIITGDLNKAMEEVKRAQEHLARELEKIDGGKMQKEMLEARAELNARDVQVQIEKAMRQLDRQKLNKELQLKNIDMEKIQAETGEAMRKADFHKMKQEIEKAQLNMNVDKKRMEADMQASMESASRAMAKLNSTDMQKLQRKLERSRDQLKINEAQVQEAMERSRKEIDEKMHRNFQKGFEKAHEDIKKAHEELQDYKEMLLEMQKDKLIKSQDNYTIKFKNGELFIDGDKQPAAVTEKYRHYFKKGNTTLSRSTDDEKTIHL